GGGRDGSITIPTRIFMDVPPSLIAWPRARLLQAYGHSANATRGALRAASPRYGWAKRGRRLSSDPMKARSESFRRVRERSRHKARGGCFRVSDALFWRRCHAASNPLVSSPRRSPNRAVDRCGRSPDLQRNTLAQQTILPAT